MNELVLSDETLNRYGTRILTKGFGVDNFKKNPVMFYNHDRNKLPIGKWENIKKTNGQLTATPTFDLGDEFAKEVARKYEAGFLGCASVGILVTAVSNDPELMLQGQAMPTITKCELLEVSIVDVPANPNAVRLYYKNDNQELLELNVNDLATLNFEPTQTNKQMTEEQINQKITDLQASYDTKITELEAKIATLETQIGEQKTALETSTKFSVADVIETLKFQSNAPAKSLLATLNAHPERTYEDWWEKDSDFLQELKAKHPEVWQTLRGE